MTATEEPSCGIARECGGCAQIETPYAAQVRAKTARVRDALARYPSLAEVVLDSCVEAPQRWRYRNRAKLAVQGDGNRVRIGLYRRGTNEIVDLAPCVVQRPVLQLGLEALRSWLTRHRLAVPHGPVFYLDLRETLPDRCHVTLVVESGQCEPATLPVADLFAEFAKLDGLAVNFGARRSSFPLGRESLVVRGGEDLKMAVERMGGGETVLEVPVAGFFQVSTALLPEIHRRMLDHLGRDGALWDLYCGVGVHGLLLALEGTGGAVVGIEESEPACRAARRNAERLSIEASYHQGLVESVLPPLLRSAAPARMVLNPGRSGCRPASLDAIAALRATRIAYLSCDPDSLARDLDRLAGKGRRIRRVTPFDLMAHTEQVEALALIE